MDLFLPNIAYASVDSFVANVNRLIINPIIGFLFALAVVYFLWGVFQFIANEENEEKKTAGKSHMLWGVIGITIMMGVFAFMNIILNTFNVDGINLEQGKVELDEYNPSSPYTSP
ncbi:hypothetical protein A2911_02270 [Candidatus Nomurabacteria bacterium RIFCSPLOWO2_01_FULL_40_15]|uniref:Uncharacterized protein n=1 Tax=Candidatus Nomurabacteria bacterium RIFCSPLOWO2_01_FULL_40_15 TaxID=1801772 RepID=A0A1F6X858_9BACT|nr:MAG: hypothetical protein A2911_02270 [Candidatus Nomurabacteria bacterium RIFCSPLOWO2_01_FULL_40_15]